MDVVDEHLLGVTELLAKSQGDEHRAHIVQIGHEEHARTLWFLGIQNPGYRKVQSWWQIVTGVAPTCSKTGARHLSAIALGHTVLLFEVN